MTYSKSLYITLVSILALACFMTISKRPSKQTKLINFVPSAPGSSLVEHHIIGGGGTGRSGVSGGSGGAGLPQQLWPVTVDPFITDAGGGGGGGYGGKMMLKTLEPPYDATQPGGGGGSGIPEFAIIRSHNHRQESYTVK